MVVLAAMFPTVHGYDARQEQLLSNVFQDTISTQLLITAPFAAAFMILGSTVTAVQLLHHAKAAIMLMLIMDAAFVAMFTPHGRLVQAMLNHLHVMISIMSMMLKQTALSAQASQEDLYQLATQLPII